MEGLNEKDEFLHVSYDCDYTSGNIEKYYFEDANGDEYAICVNQDGDEWIEE